jgi:hypothetical protein
MRLLLCIVASAILSGCDPNTNTIKSELTSPDGKHVATAFIRDGGATTSWSPQVHLRRVGEHMERIGNIFVGYRSREIQIEWLSPTQLVIYCDCEVIQHVTNHDGITIEKRVSR